MDIEEFVKGGYLQEVNRRLMHILGLAIEVEVDEKGNFELSGIWDYRHDPEGLVFDKVNYEYVEKIQHELDKKIQHRQKTLGWFLQPYEVPKTLEASV